jgi:hypothetical protein
MSTRGTLSLQDAQAQVSLRRVEISICMQQLVIVLDAIRPYQNIVIHDRLSTCLDVVFSRFALGLKPSNSLPNAFGVGICHAHAASQGST